MKERQGDTNTEQIKPKRLYSAIRDLAVVKSRLPLIKIRFVWSVAKCQIQMVYFRNNVIKLTKPKKSVLQ